MATKYGYMLDENGNATPISDPGAYQRGEVVDMAADSQMLGGKPGSEYVQTANVINNFTTTEAGYVADARTVSELNDIIKNGVDIDDDDYVTILGGIKAMRRHGIVYFTADGSVGMELPASTETIIANDIPQKYRPRVHTYIYVATAGTRTNGMLMAILTDGRIKIYNYSGTSANYAYGSTSYVGAVV